MIETMTVTMIVPVDRRRCKVFLDEGFAFVLYRGELEQYGICEGFEISQKLYQRIEEEILKPRARDLCLKLLGDLDRSERQLRERLARAGFPQRVVGRVMDYLREYRYTDDRRMAAYYVESRGHQLIYHTRTGECTAAGGTIQQAESDLKGHSFFRSNKGYLVNLEYVDAVRDGCALVKGQELPISRARKNDFMEALAGYVGEVAK